MSSLRVLTLVSLILATPSLALAQGKSKPPHVPPPAVVRKSAVVHNDLGKNDAAKDAAKAARDANKAADKIADKSERAAEKSEHSALKLARDEKLLTRGITLTPSEEAQIKAIEKNYDAQYRALRQSDKQSDKTTKKNGTADDNAAFLAQLSTLETQERTALRAALTPQQQAIFDSNVSKLSSHK